MQNEQQILDRQDMGIYSIDELAELFKISRRSIDNAITAKELTYIAPNNKQKFVLINDFLEYMHKKSSCPTLQNKATANNSKSN